jgi:hypothetical protein
MNAGRIRGITELTDGFMIFLLMSGWGRVQAVCRISGGRRRFALRARQSNGGEDLSQAKKENPAWSGNFGPDHDGELPGSRTDQVGAD